jgi:hypothetical protein
MGESKILVRILYESKKVKSNALPAYLNVVHADLRNGLDLSWCNAWCL